MTEKFISRAHVQRNIIKIGGCHVAPVDVEVQFLSSFLVLFSNPFSIPGETRGHLSLLPCSATIVLYSFASCTIHLCFHFGISVCVPSCRTSLVSMGSQVQMCPLCVAVEK